MDDLVTVYAGTSSKRLHDALNIVVELVKDHNSGFGPPAASTL